MPTIYEMSTAQIEPRRRAAFWQERARAAGGMMAHAVDWTRFDGRVRLAMLDQLKFGRIVASAHDANWTKDLLTSADDAFLRILLQCKGTALVEQGDARFFLRPGEWTVLNASRSHLIRSEEDVEEMIVMVPRAAIVPRLFDASRKLGRAHSADSNVGRLLFSFARTLIDETTPGASPLDEHLEGAALELVRALLDESLGNETVSTCREIRIERITAYIDRHICDPDLSVERIARAMSCSKRYVHALFAGGPSVHSRIWNARLERCARDLRREDMAETKITTISLSNGFSCPAHFSRMFKAKYGIPPREYRPQNGMSQPS